MNFFRLIAERFRKNRKVYVFFICFVIAVLFWFLLALTKEYSSALRVKVVYGNFPQHLLVVNALPQELLLNVKTNGYHLISLNNSGEENILNIDVQSLTGTETGAKSISSQMLIQNFIEQLGNDVSITSIQPDSISFEMSSSTVVKLPVRANTDVTFEKQFDAVSPVRINPDSVNVTIPFTQIGKILWIETEIIQAKKLRASLKRKIKLIAPASTVLNTSEAELILDVEKFTEGTLSVPVSLINVPRGLKVKIFPDHVSVKYLVALSRYDNVKPDMFSAISDASSSASGSADKMNVQIISYPSFVRSVSCQPEKVDFILKK